MVQCGGVERVTWGETLPAAWHGVNVANGAGLTRTARPDIDLAMHGRVSILMPAYNAAPWIAESIASVQAQTYANWELLVVDDGSTDATVEIVRRIATSDLRVRLFRFPKNTGLAAKARNYGYSRSCGEFVAFLDADDLWLPTKLQRQVEILGKSPDVAAVATWYDVFGDAERAAAWNRMMWRDNSEWITREQILNNTPATPTLMVRRGAFEGLGGMEVRKSLATGEDREFIVRLVFRHKVARIPEPLVKVRVHPMGKSLSTRDLENRRNREREILKSLVRKKTFSSIWKKRFEAIFFYNQAKDALFHFGRPWRGDLFRSLATGHAPPKAWVMAALSFLPALLLRPLLEGLLALRNPGVRA